MIKRGCRVLAVWAGLTAFGASASLPPLPAVWPAASLDTQVPGLPLPQGAVEGADHTVATEVDPPPFDQAARAALQAEAASRAPGWRGRRSRWRRPPGWATLRPGNRAMLTTRGGSR